MKLTTKALRALRITKIGVIRCSYLWFGVLIFIFQLPLFPAQSQSIYPPGYEQYQRKQFDSAVSLYSEFIAANPERKEGYYNRGLCYYHLDKAAEAISDFNVCLRIDSVFDDARFMKALALQQRGDWENSCIEFKKLNTRYAGYNELRKRILYHRISVLISRNWYYMIAIMFMFILFVGIVAKSYYLVKR